MHIINKITVSKHQLADQRSTPALALEKAGDFFASPGRLLFARAYSLENSNGKQILKSPELFSPLAKIAAIILFPLTLVATLFGLALKAIAHKMHPDLLKKYSLPTLINARQSDDFVYKLPPNPWTPNCVNSQQKSIWGKLYNADPIQIPLTVKDPIAQLKSVLSSAKEANLNSQLLELVEEMPSYLHYTYTVVIPSGPIKGTYIDDIDIYYDHNRRVFEIRSASRVGFRDALHANMNLPGANKKRIEAIRSAFSKSLGEKNDKNKDAAPAVNVTQQDPSPLKATESLPAQIPTTVQGAEQSQTPSNLTTLAPDSQNAQTQANDKMQNAVPLANIPQQAPSPLKAPEQPQAMNIQASTHSIVSNSVPKQAPLIFTRECRAKYHALIDQFITFAKILKEAKRNFLYSEHDLDFFLKKIFKIDPLGNKHQEKDQTREMTLLQQMDFLIGIYFGYIERDKNRLESAVNTQEEKKAFSNFVHDELLRMARILAEIKDSCILSPEDEREFNNMSQKLLAKVRLT